MALDHGRLVENILNFDEVVYKASLEQFMKENGIFEDGKASKRVVKMIERWEKRDREGIKENKLW